MMVEKVVLVGVLGLIDRGGIVQGCIAILIVLFFMMLIARHMPSKTEECAAHVHGNAAHDAPSATDAAVAATTAAAVAATTAAAAAATAATTAATIAATTAATPPAITHDPNGLSKSRAPRPGHSRLA
jgi:predicted lipid-binding transport protein (Tim44 family)